MRRLRTWIFALALGLGLAVATLFGLSARAKASRPRIAAALLERAPLPPATPPGLYASWTGVAGVRLEAVPPEGTAAGTATVLIDPYVTRHALAELAFPIDVDTDTAARAFPVAQAIFIGQGHHDHLGDAPFLANRTGATLYGSRTTCALAQGLGLARERCVVMTDGSHATVGPFDVEAVEHVHGESAAGVPFPGEVEVPPASAPHVWEMKAGTVLAFIVRAQGKTVYHQGSAGLTDRQLARLTGLAPDLALIGIALRQHTPSFEERLLGALRPKRVAAIHEDDFFGPALADEVPLLRGVDLPGFEAKARALAGAGAVVRLVPFERVEVK
jgi:L-ascorbate metabolism protein UlaG (beta-lactamase superfamily)